MAALVDSLAIELGDGPRLGPVTEDLNAYDLYLLARAHFHARSSLDTADDLLRRALERHESSEHIFISNANVL